MVAIASVAGLLAAGAVATTSATASATSVPRAVVPASSTSAYTDGHYIVVLKSAPAVAYRGGRDGFASTAPKGSANYNGSSAAAERYTNFLAGQQRRIASSVGARPYASYSTALNGFAAELSGSQATALAKRGDVIAVVKDQLRQVDTVHTPSFLGLTGPVGVWRRLGGSDPANGAGRGQVIGVVDTGANSDSASFAAVGSPAPASYTGPCVHGDYAPGDPGYFDCNDKLIGGRFYTEGAEQLGIIGEDDYLSPEDNEGHGSHTASTAAGNSGVNMTVNGTDFGDGSGMAPAAKIATYKVCYEGGCADSDSVDAIDDAVADGVDVINYSISGAIDNVVDPVEIAFLYAADAGVFVAASAGNSGPGASTVAHPSPWLTTVAAATHKLYEGTVELGDGQTFVGASVAQDDVTDKPLVLSKDAEAAGQDEADAQLCFLGSLDPAKVDGKIVVCDRGGNARVEKSQEVNNAGGVGMILVNTIPDQGLNADIHAVPSVHLDVPAHDPVYAYAETADPTASILAGVGDGSTGPTPPAIAAFSSRGPSLAAEGDLLKPDITAPGVDVLAAVAPEGNSGHDFDIYSGTSMSSPHIAGLAMLIQQAHPGWSPMEVKSSMMTTAENLTDTANPFDQGAGFVRPRSFLNPGLVFNSDFDDWMNYLAGQGVTVGGEPITDTPIEASNLNVPSIALNSMAGRETVYRTVTNVESKGSTYTVSKARLRGIRVQASPKTFFLGAGQSREIALTFTRRNAELGTYRVGSVFFKDGRGGHIVRIPAVVRPVGIEAPSEVSGPTFTIETKSGVGGTISRNIRGLVPGFNADHTVTNTDGAGFDPSDPRNYSEEISITGPLDVARIAEAPANGVDDLDLFVTDAGGNVVAASATGSPAEEVTVTGLDTGSYFVFVQAFAAADHTSDFTLTKFQVGLGNRGNMQITPRTHDVSVGETVRWNGTTSGLDPSKSYLGTVLFRHKSAAGRPVLGTTLVSIN